MTRIHANTVDTSAMEVPKRWRTTSVPTHCHQRWQHKSRLSSRLHRCGCSCALCTRKVAKEKLSLWGSGNVRRFWRPQCSCTLRRVFHRKRTGQRRSRSRKTRKTRRNWQCTAAFKLLVGFCLLLKCTLGLPLLLQQLYALKFVYYDYLGLLPGQSAAPGAVTPPPKRLEALVRLSVAFAV
jgi:hypothetical protein